ncbi:MAG: ADP-ribosylation factor-like protein [Promethearchaeota archaeon]
MSTQETSKIALLGLAAAGKTSYLEVLRQEFKALYDIRATVGVDRNRIRILGSDFYIYDYGGQQVYREDYITNSSRYLNQIDLLLYFVDVQDLENLDNSIEYYKSLFSLPEIKTIDPDKIFILIHKMDPEIKSDPRIRSRVKKIKEDFDAIKKAQYFETSINDYWSIIFSFSGAFRKIRKIEDVLKKILKEFARATFSSGVVLVDTNFLILDKHASNEENLKITDELFQQFVGAWAKQAAEGNPPQTLQIELEEGKGYFQRFKYENEEYYIMAYSRNPRTEKLILEKLPELANRIFEILMGFYFED